ncbi:sprT-like domain-containing protein Spartan isoform X2 [Mizuhopecten yessoensis]|nr:sprT-like domain-containing protein Spartan isoform X2 [Mizuhopecten yessoensis]
MDTDEDLALALQLQSELDEEAPAVAITTPTDHSKLSPVDPSWEYLDPIPDIRALFLQFNDQFFWGRLAGIEVRWSPRMTLCAGLCSYEGRGGLCSVRLSVPLLKLRPRKDLVQTLLHEMIHAYLFVTDNNTDHDGHGPQFHSHMYRINKETGANISVYHTFHEEVENYRQHWWRCTGPCRERKPYFGYVKRAMNRAPSERDTWWKDHKNSCNGIYEKVKEPEGYGEKKKTSEKSESTDIKKREKVKEINKNMDIRLFAGKGNVLSAGRGKDNSVNIVDKKLSAIGTSHDRVQKTLTGGLDRSSSKIVPTVKGGNKSNVTSTVTSGKKSSATSTVTSRGKSSATSTVTSRGKSSATPTVTSGKKSSTITGEKNTGNQPIAKSLVNGILFKKVSVHNGVTGSSSQDLSGSRSPGHVSAQSEYHDNHIVEAGHISILNSDEEDSSEIFKPAPTKLVQPGGASNELTSGQGDVRSKLRDVWANRFNSASSVTGLPALSRPKKRTQDFEPNSSLNPSVAKRCKGHLDVEHGRDNIFITTNGDQDLPSISRPASKSLISGSQDCFNSRTNVTDVNSQNSTISGSKKTALSSSQMTNNIHCEHKNTSGSQKISIPGKKKPFSGSQKAIIDSSQNTVSGMFSKMKSPGKDKLDGNNDRIISLDASSTFHECPVCTKRVLETEMNHHLDLCLLG